MQAFLPEPPPNIRRVRLDSLMPLDPETGAVETEALKSYISISLEMMQRTNGTLAVVLASLDESPLLAHLGMQGSQPLAKSVVQYLQQESRTYDVVGRLSHVGALGVPVFALVSPLCNEVQASALAQRVCNQMLYIHQERESPWLSLSIGIAVSNWTTNTPNELLDYAEYARQYAQRSGGGQIVRYSTLTKG